MKVGYELELLAPIGQTRFSVASVFSQKLNLPLNACFHRESDFWPEAKELGPYYCLTKGFELAKNGDWQLRIINDMTICDSLDPNQAESPEWYHVLADDIRIIDLILCQCDPQLKVDNVLSPIAQLFKTELHEKGGIHSVVGNKSNLICGVHSKMADRNRICEIVTAPITENHDEKLEEIILISKELGCLVPKEGAFHIHFDGKAFASSKMLLRAIRYFYVWSDVLKAMIPPNPYCTRLGEYKKEVLDYAFKEDNEKKPFEKVVQELKALGPTKYCDFNFNNILIGDPKKYTFEVRVIPMLLDATALSAASNLYMGFMNFILSQNVQYPQEKKAATPEHISSLIESIC